ncbi:site-specific integrase [Chitinophagaceae bacterium LB-8]|uniref:Site-specific integrase n=1 Tax=Paraflavisolibacter caeni TaxID=2982496 RepID=A0A9X2XZI1_9BACT|nr:site-specific integrase [Paraflavisolibacter caeni]MCU7551800.1 site-specific integrase [Paraflavisolibacter caeni]
MNILFWLYKSRMNKKGLAPIMMRISLEGKRINFPTQIEIEETQWDKDRQKVKGSNDLVKAYNKQLLILNTNAWNYYNECLRQQMPLALGDIKQALLGENKSEHTILGAIEYQIANLKARVHNDIAPRTVKKYETVKRKVKEFLAEEWKTEDILLSQVNHQFIFELDTFMRVKQGLHNNGVAKNMQQLKRVIRIAMLNEWMEKDPFAKYQCKLIEPKRVHLTNEELQHLELLPLPSERLIKVKDIFVFACYTGLAYADVSKLSKEHIQWINKRNWIILDRTKTKNQSTIPLLPKAEEILKKYGGEKGKELLPVISSQNLNKYLKEIAGMAGFKKRLSFHAARHTFASLALNNGVDITTVSAMLGHKMLKTTQIYARVNLNKIANDVEKFYKKG